MGQPGAEVDGLQAVSLQIQTPGHRAALGVIALNPKAVLPVQPQNQRLRKLLGGAKGLGGHRAVLEEQPVVGIWGFLAAVDNPRLDVAVSVYPMEAGGGGVHRQRTGREGRGVILGGNVLLSAAAEEQQKDAKQGDKTLHRNPS